MKIKEVSEETQSGLNIPRLEKAKVISLKEGDCQVLRVEDADGNKVSIFIKCRDLHSSNDIIGKYVEFVAAPPKNGKSSGILIKIVDDKPRIIITAGATMRMSDSAEGIIIQKEPEQMQEPIQLTETEQTEGPADKIIREVFYERLHILNILKQENIDNGNPFSIDSLFPMVTSIYIDASKANKKILPAAVPSPKKKFDAYEKPADPPTAPDPEDPVIAYINSCKKEPWYKAKDSKGTPYKDILADESRRPRAMCFMFNNKLKDMKDKPELMHARDTLLNFFEGADRMVQSQLATEAMMYDQQDISGLTDKDEIIELVSLAADKFKGVLKPTNFPGIANQYFAASKSERDVR